MATDARSQPWAMILTAGSKADVNHAPALIADRHDASSVLMDKAYDSDALREYISNRGMKSCIPSRSNRVEQGQYSLQFYKKAASSGEIF